MSEVFTWISQEMALTLGLAAIAILFLHNFLTEARDKKRLENGEPGVRMSLYATVMRHLWGLALVVTIAWLASGRDLVSLGLGASVSGWQSWLAWGLAAAGCAYLIYSVASAATSVKARQSLRRQIENAGDVDLIRPETSPEYARFRYLAVTAGITEEIIFRGFLIGTLSLFLPLPFAAALSVLIFVLGHAYQGPAGMLRIVPISIVLTTIFVLSGSLWPAIILHAVTDLVGGALFQIVNTHKDEDANAEVPA